MTAFTATYDFDCLEIEIDGIRVGSFTGTADLSEDGSDFVVDRIWLDGEKVERRADRILPSKVSRHKVPLPKPPLHADWTFENMLFDRIAEALYSSRDAAEFWAEELMIASAA